MKKYTIHILLVLMYVSSIALIPPPGIPTVATFSIHGTVTYIGTNPADVPIDVYAFTNISGSPVDGVQIPSDGGAYEITDLPPDTYYIAAIKDLDNSGGEPGPNEPESWYDPDGDGTPNPVTISSNDVFNIDIALDDPVPSITGSLTYLASPAGNHKIIVAAHPENTTNPPATSGHFPPPYNTYALYKLTPGTFYISAFLDLNDSGGGPPDAGEPVTWYDANNDGIADPVSYSEGTLTDINLTLGNIIYVNDDANGNHTGISWTDAYTDLQSALSVATAGDVIWVAEGTYFPGPNRSDSFQLKNDVSLYGGFAGTETDRSQRNPAEHPTILSGNIGDQELDTDNNYHVIDTSNTNNTAILDGFIISLGYANGSGENDKGGGVYNLNGSPYLVNIVFLNNFASNHGGAIVNSGFAAKPLIVNCIFSGNTTNYNGAIANLNDAEPTILNTTLSGNSGGNAGGIVNISANAIVANTILWDNSVAEISMQTGGTISITYSIIEGGYTGTGNIATNPAFVDADGADNTYGTLDDDLSLQAGSPAIDAGNNKALPQDNSDTDSDGDFVETLNLDISFLDRQIDDPDVIDTGNGSAPIVDIGAYEQLEPISGLSASNSSPNAAFSSTTFTATATTGNAITYNWDFGDGTSGTGETTDHTYTVAGNYMAQVTASNERNTVTATTTVKIYDEVSITPGGTYTSTDDIIVIVMPEDITETLVISYTPVTTFTIPHPDLPFEGTAFELFSSATDGTPITQPTKPLVIKVSYGQANTLSRMSGQTEPALFRYDEATQAWIQLSTLALDEGNKLITASLDHFSLFAVFYTPSTYDLFLPLLQR